MNPSQAEITQQSQQQYSISGAVDFTTAPDLMQRANAFFKKNKVAQGQINVDLSKVTECNSAGLALMFEMAKSAQKINVEIRFEHLPDTLLTITKAYGVEAEVMNISE